MRVVVTPVVAVVLVCLTLLGCTPEAESPPSSAGLTDYSLQYIAMCSSIDPLTHSDLATVGCMARLRGFVDGHIATAISLKAEPFWCVPQSETDGDILLNVTRWVEQHPFVLAPQPSIDSSTATLLIANKALSELYPCTSL